jgi:hypothetical protein
MRDSPACDHLELWRGIDDAIWREASRAEAARASVAASLAAAPPAPSRRVPRGQPGLQTPLLEAV